MLKLPKGLKKKKKGKKSKKDQELFTEEELEQYRREHQKQAEAEQESVEVNHQVEESVQDSSTSFAVAEGSGSGVNPAPSQVHDDEWRRFNALATGVDSILKKTQGDLDRIKSTSFFQRVPTPNEKKQAEDAKLKKKQEEQQRLEAEEAARREKEEQEAKNDITNAVIELPDSESGESDTGDDIFDTTYIDVVKELPLAYVPESPEQEELEGPDPFDTSYAEKVIKGPEVSKKGKKLVSIGSAVEVLTGRVESTSQKSSSRRPRRGPKDLLLVQSFDEENVDELLEKTEDQQTTIHNLLDSPTDLPDAPIDLSVSLHLSLQTQKKDEPVDSEFKEEEPTVDPSILDEFDLIKNKVIEDEDNFDEFDQIAAESALKQDIKGKPSRPPPPIKSSLVADIPYLVDEDELKTPEDNKDPFDTKFVEQLLPASLNEDPDFDPRAFDEEETKQEELFSPDFPKEINLGPQKDLLSISTTDLTNLPEVALAPAEKEEKEFDPFDTSAISSIVAPGKSELKYIEKELLEANLPPPRPPQPVIGIKPSLSDPDFDPRGGETIHTHKGGVYQTAAERKSSLSLHIHTTHPQHKVTFAVPTPDLLAIGDSGKIQKPLTPYYNKESVFEETSAEEDPFDTSFVSESKPSQVELSYIEKDLLANNSNLGLSDDEFDPRAVTPEPIAQKSSDLLSVSENHNIKVLTPKIEAKDQEPESSYLSDPFDTSSIECNILPGRAELKLIESELLPEVKQEPLSDILSFSQDDSLPVKALTPQIPVAVPNEDIDPFDTSFACNLAPGQAEIKLLESELIEK